MHIHNHRQSIVTTLAKPNQRALQTIYEHFWPFQQARTFCGYTQEIVCWISELYFAKPSGQDAKFKLANKYSSICVPVCLE